MEKMYYLTRESIVEIFRRWDAAVENTGGDPEASADAFIKYGEFEFAGNADEG